MDDNVINHLAELKLCYIWGENAYFTTDLEKQTGHNWDLPISEDELMPDEPIPVEGNNKVFNLMVKYDAKQIELPTGHCPNIINEEKIVPWAIIPGVAIWAGTSLSEFVETIMKNKGEVFLPYTKDYIEIAKYLINETSIKFDEVITKKSKQKGQK